MSISWTRQSYEATVLLIPLDPRARGAISACDSGSLEGIVVAGEDTLAENSAGLLDVDAPVRGETRDIDGRAASSTPLEVTVHDADMSVVLVRDLSALDCTAVERIGDAVRSSGRVLGAIVISPNLRWHSTAEHRAATALREAADTVVVLSELDPALAFLQVLRGGSRARPLAADAS